MKLIIDIDKDDYENMKNGCVPHRFNMLYAIPIPDNATNGDVIKAIFPDCDETGVQYELTKNCNGWLDEPYQKGGKE